LSFCNGEGVIEKNKLYEFSPEVKQTLLKWFYENQDAKTGFWGPKSKNSGELLKIDLNNTASIIKAFTNKDGKDIYSEFPIKNKNSIFNTTIKCMEEPIPDDDDLEEWHEWNLKIGKGSAMVVRYLWNDVTFEDKEKAKALFEKFINLSFQKNYIPKEGAFSYNPNSSNATIDGTGTKLGDLLEIGFFSSAKQEKLWGELQKQVTDLGTTKVSHLSEDSFNTMVNFKGVNSIRFYKGSFNINDPSANIFAVVYPNKTQILDAFDIGPKVINWVNNTSQTMGNWTSKEEILDSLNIINKKAVPVFNGFPIDNLNNSFVDNNNITAVGYDILQLPKCKITFERY
jgi:hypothetical protein